jgi:hypothetical protein
MEFPVLKHKANLTAQAHPGLPKDVLFTVSRWGGRQMAMQCCNLQHIHQVWQE